MHDALRIGDDIKEVLNFFMGKDNDNWKYSTSTEKFKGIDQSTQVKVNYNSKIVDKPRNGNFVKPNTPRPYTTQICRC